MKKYLPILGMVAVMVLAMAATSFGTYDPIINSFGVEPDTDEHPWGGDGLYIDNGNSTTGGTYDTNPIQYFYFDLSGTFGFIIILNTDVDSTPPSTKLQDTQDSSGGTNPSTQGIITGKGN